MGTPSDKKSISKVVPEISTQTEDSQLEVSQLEDSDLQENTEMTILRNIPSLGIFLEGDYDHSGKDLFVDTGQNVNLETLDKLEKELLITSELNLVKKVQNVEELDIPGPSGLQLKKKFECSVCNKNFNSATKLVSHQNIHGESTPFKCEECKKSFSSKFKLVRHVLIHSDRKPFSCTVCERTFHRKDHLKNHIKVHSPSKKVFTCEKTNCRKEYTSIMSYRKHLALHSAEDGSLDCKICSKTFDSKPEILYHLKIHAGSRTVKNPNEKKFTCDHCDRKFFTRKDVRRHLVVHTGTRNFLCQFCPQRFGRKDHLVRHIKKSHSTTISESDILYESKNIEPQPQKFEVPVEPETKLNPDQYHSESRFHEVTEKTSFLPEGSTYLGRTFSEGSKFQADILLVGSKSIETPEKTVPNLLIYSDTNSEISAKVNFELAGLSESIYPDGNTSISDLIMFRGQESESNESNKASSGPNVLTYGTDSKVAESVETALSSTMLSDTDSQGFGDISEKIVSESSQSDIKLEEQQNLLDFSSEESILDDSIKHEMVSVENILVNESVEKMLNYPSESDIKLDESQKSGISVENILFPQTFSELSPMLCSETDSLQYLPQSDRELFIKNSNIPSETELLTELVVMKEELEQCLGGRQSTSQNVDLLNVGQDMNDLNNSQLMTSEMIDSDILRLISEGSGDLTQNDDDNNLPLPGFSQAFQQPP